MRNEAETETTRAGLRREGLRRAQGVKSKRFGVTALLFCLLLTACPSAGGDLLPLLQAEDGGQLESASFKNDTLSVTHDEVTIKARGSWSASDSNTLLTLEITNRSAVSVVIAFDSCEMVNNERAEKLSLRSLAEYKEGGAHAFINERSLSIESGQTRRYYADFFIKAADNRASASRDVEGQSLTLRVPVALQKERPAPVDFLFSFKYVEYQH